MAQQQQISRRQLEEMFTNIEATTSWDMKREMLWGYFFTGPDKGDLEKAGAELVGSGYRLVEIRELDSDSPQLMTQWQLHVERVETQSVDTLSIENAQLEDLARRYGSIAYDGMDVCPVE